MQKTQDLPLPHPLSLHLPCPAKSHTHTTDVFKSIQFYFQLLYFDLLHNFT